MSNATSGTPATPVVSVHTVELKPRPEAWQPPATVRTRFMLRRAFVAPTMGLSKLGCSVIEVPAGATAYPYHSHRSNEELFFILEGRGELRLGDARHAVKAGDLIGCPTGGPETAHQLINTGDTPLRYLGISTQLEPDVCEYPDSGKVGVYTGDFMHLWPMKAQADYWDGE